MCWLHICSRLRCTSAAQTWLHAGQSVYSIAQLHRHSNSDALTIVTSSRSAQKHSAVGDLQGRIPVVLHACPGNHMQCDWMPIGLSGSSLPVSAEASDCHGPEAAVQPCGGCAEEKHNAGGGNERQRVPWREPNGWRQGGPHAEYHLHITTRPSLIIT